MNLRSLLPIAIAGLLVGCGTTDNQRRWSDAADFARLPVMDPVTVAEGKAWRLDVGVKPHETGEPTGSCLQAVVVEQPLGCIRVDGEDGSDYGFATQTRVGEDRVIWSANTISATEDPVDHFVVWSSAFPDGRRLEPIVYNDVENLIWIMEPNEAPWGYQAIAPDGTLLMQRSHVGLSPD